MSDNTDNSVKTLRSKIEAIKFCMLTTIKDDCCLTSRPMTLQDLDDDGTLWFFTSDTSEVSRDISLNPKINVSFAEPSDNIYVSVSGKAAIVREQAKVEELWNTAVSIWFPQGIDDPHLTLIKFKIDFAEYWDSKSDRMIQFLSMAKAAISGEQPRDIGQHETLSF